MKGNTNMAATLTGTASGVGGTLTVKGTGFTSSSGGQMVILWVGYPNDYCSPDKSVCHGFYAYPNVADDGTFEVTYDNALPQAGTGKLSTIEYIPKRDKWVTVATATYTCA